MLLKNFLLNFLVRVNIFFNHTSCMLWFSELASCSYFTTVTVVSCKS